MHKINRTDAVSVTEVVDNHFFVESDKGNFIAIKKNGTIVIETYEGKLQDYMADWEVDRPKGKQKNGCFNDLLPGIVRYVTE
jgi:hypothetical protein